MPALTPAHTTHNGQCQQHSHSFLMRPSAAGAQPVCDLHACTKGWCTVSARVSMVVTFPAPQGSPWQLLFMHPNALRVVHTILMLPVCKPALSVAAAHCPQSLDALDNRWHDQGLPHPPPPWPLRPLPLPTTTTTRPLFMLLLVFSCPHAFYGCKNNFLLTIHGCSDALDDLHNLLQGVAHILVHAPPLWR